MDESSCCTISFSWPLRIASPPIPPPSFLHHLFTWPCVAVATVLLSAILVDTLPVHSLQLHRQPNQSGLEEGCDPFALRSLCCILITSQAPLKSQPVLPIPSNLYKRDNKRLEKRRRRWQRKERRAALLKTGSCRKEEKRIQAKRGGKLAAASSSTC